MYFGSHDRFLLASHHHANETTAANATTAPTAMPAIAPVLSPDGFRDVDTPGGRIGTMLSMEGNSAWPTVKLRLS